MRIQNLPTPNSFGLAAGRDESWLGVRDDVKFHGVPPRRRCAWHRRFGERHAQQPLPQPGFLTGFLTGFDFAMLRLLSLLRL
jgi:hypothetical protein